jgi:hypothetical protein
MGKLLYYNITKVHALALSQVGYLESPDPSCPRRRGIYRDVRQGFDRRRECGIVLAGQGDRCAAAKPALTGCARCRAGFP